MKSGWGSNSSNSDGDTLSSEKREQFETISQYFLSCDIISSGEMDKMVLKYSSSEKMPPKHAKNSYDAAVVVVHRNHHRKQSCVDYGTKLRIFGTQASIWMMPF